MQYMVILNIIKIRSSLCAVTNAPRAILYGAAVMICFVFVYVALKARKLMCSQG
jgi:hypothetical protein